MFVERNALGQIVRAFGCRQDAELEELADDSPELVAYLAVPIERRMTALEFLDLFTEAEQLAVLQAAMASPAINLWWTKLTMATYVDFDDPRLAAGLDAIVAAGLLTPARRAEIFA